jgi:hypothetical protein
MPSYHCYFLDDQHHIRGTEVLETALLRDAIDLSLSMLKKRKHHKVEVWEGSCPAEWCRSGYPEQRRLL